MTKISTKYDNENLYNEFQNFLKYRKKKYVPVSVFCKELTALETVVKYLVEVYDLGYSDVGRLISKDRQVIWITYKRACRKVKEKFELDFSEYNIPVSELDSDKLSMTELVVGYLKDFFRLKNTEIAKLLERDDRTIWTIYHRVEEKNEN